MNPADAVNPHIPAAAGTARPRKMRDHAHEYRPCILEGTGGGQSARIAMYCTVCGRIGGAPGSRWERWIPVNGGPAGHMAYTEEAERELNPETRTLPAFAVDDIWAAKLVNAKSL